MLFIFFLIIIFIKCLNKKNYRVNIINYDFIYILKGYNCCVNIKCLMVELYLFLFKNICILLIKFWGIFIIIGKYSLWMVIIK